MPSRLPLSRLLDGPPPALPGPLDAAAERWSRLRPRARFALVLALLGLTVIGLTARLASSPWGEPVPVLVATRTLDTGEALTSDVARVVRWPATVVPEGALPDLVDGLIVGRVPAGSPITTGHLGEGGLAALAGPGTTVVPLPRETLPHLPVGARVDVVASDHDLRGSALAQDARVLGSDDSHVWVEVPRAAAPDVAAAGLRGAIVLVLVADAQPDPIPSPTAASTRP
jgi:hypothetical protein